MLVICAIYYRLQFCDTYWIAFKYHLRLLNGHKLNEIVHFLINLNYSEILTENCGRRLIINNVYKSVKFIY